MKTSTGKAEMSLTPLATDPLASLIGGLGNDTYGIDNAGDVVTESANKGTDLVQSIRS